MGNSGRKNEYIVQHPMILMIFNHIFPHDSGFASRCKNELDMLSESEDIMVLCRKDEGTNEPEVISTPFRKVQIHRFSPISKAIERPDTVKYIAGIYEIIRAVDLFISFSFALVTVLLTYSFKQKIKIHCVNSPLTLSLFTWCISLIFPVNRSVLEFHDLEPEMAKHIKNLSDKSIVMKIELFLETFLCRQFQKIIVTSETQKTVLSKRTGKSKERIFILPNLPKEIVRANYSKEPLLKKYNIVPTEFVVAYSSNLTFGYTTDGLEELLEDLPKLIQQIPQLHIIVAGDGDGLPLLRKKVKDLQLEKSVTFTGRIPDVFEIVAIADVCIIPWKKNVLSETILPTKLLEYMAFGVAIVAPSFGEFKKRIINGDTGLLYSDSTELIQALLQLNTDPQKRKYLAQNAKDYYTKKFNKKEIAEQLGLFLKTS